MEPSNESLGEKVMRWHKVICTISGGLAHRLAKRTISRNQLDEWANALHQICNELTTEANRKEGK